MFIKKKSVLWKQIIISVKAEDSLRKELVYEWVCQKVRMSEDLSILDSFLKKMVTRTILFDI